VTGTGVYGNYNGGTQLLSAEYVSARLGEACDSTVFYWLSGRIHRICRLFLGDSGKQGVHADGTRRVFLRYGIIQLLGSRRQRGLAWRTAVTKTLQISLGQARELFDNRFNLAEKTD